MTTLSKQCAVIGWRLQQLPATRLPNGSWSVCGVISPHPELAAAAYFSEQGISATWCEGGSINLLMKAAALDTLTKLNYFNSRTDAVQRFLEAQLTLIQQNVEEFLDAILSSTH